MAKSKEQTPKDRFLSLLKDEILKLDLADLDFGIYRILAHRRVALTRFFDETLPARLEKALAGTQAEQEQLYGLLFTFFRRYYKDGDFEPQPRHGKTGAYLVEYNGEDVHFHWRSRGSHYVKSGEQLQRYAYRDGRWEVEFTLVGAVEGKDDQKIGTRFFIPLPDQVTADQPRHKLTIPFEFRPLTPEETKAWGSKVKAADDEGGPSTTQRRVLDALVPSIALPEGGPGGKKLNQQLERFTRKERTDYFVHKDLGVFLNTELDRFLQAQLLDPEQFTGEDLSQNAHVFGDRLRMLRAARGVGREINGFLDEIEGFQATLFEKKKFVLETRWMAPVQNIPEALWSQIVANAAQKAEWKTLFALDGKVTLETLRTHPTLVVDTKHFDTPFVDALLASFEDVEESTDGLLVHGENYAALKNLAAVYSDSVDMTFIDPPYNTGNDGFNYKDDFSRHSTWLCMLNDRLQLCRRMLRGDGIFAASIDDNESHHLRLLLDQIYSSDCRLSSIAWQRKYGASNNARGIAPMVDTVHVYGRHPDVEVALMPREEEASERYVNLDNDPRGPWKPVDYWNPLSPKERPNLVYDIVNPNTGAVVQPTKKAWKYSKSTYDTHVTENRIYWGKNGTNSVPALKRFLSEVRDGVVPTNSWSHEFAGHTDAAKKEIEAILGASLFDTPKPTLLVTRLLSLALRHRGGLVLDYFAGSGSTVEAAIKLSREDGRKRKFVAVEMAHYFWTVLLPRVVKVLYSQAWKDGKPATEPVLGALLGNKPEWMTRTPRLVKVLTLERYEDSLDALRLPDRSVQSDAFFDDPTALGYRLADVVEGSPVLLNTAMLADPFEYTLAVSTPEGYRNKAVDVVETWNLLAGLRVRRRRATKGPAGRVLLVEADTRDGERVLVVWRATGDLSPAKDRDFLTAAVSRELGVEMSSYAVVWHNGDSIFGRNARSLDSEFQRLMMQREER